ncbi:hypothetical protein J5W37_004976, partial [Escherichia coli]
MASVTVHCPRCQS